MRDGASIGSRVSRRWKAVIEGVGGDSVGSSVYTDGALIPELAGL